MPAEKPPRIAARDAVSRFLQVPSGNAASQVADLLDEEVNQIVAAVADKDTARQQIKDVFTRAYDRRRESAGAEVKEVMANGDRSARARKVLERELGLSVAESIDAVGKASAEQLAALGALEPEYGCGEACQAILDGNVPATLPGEETVASDTAVAEVEADDAPADKAKPAKDHHRRGRRS
jgi:hypothetical protein